MDNPITERLYRYDNYRFFLRDYFHEMKRLRSAFSHRFFARKAGFASSSFCAHVIEGKRNLTRESLQKMVRGLGITGRAATFFEALVLYNQAGTVEERESRFRRLDRLRRTAGFYKVNQKQWAYYDEWYYPVIRELAVYAPWNGDFGRLGTMVRPPVTPEKARRAVELLLEIGMLVKRPDGTFVQTDAAVTAEDVPVSVTRKQRREFILRAVDAMEKLDVGARHVSSVTVSMSEEKYRAVTDRLDQIRREILEDAADEPGAEGVYQVNFQVFPVSVKIDRSVSGRQKGRSA